jgi:hypothetical protein
MATTMATTTIKAKGTVTNKPIEKAVVYHKLSIGPNERIFAMDEAKNKSTVLEEDILLGIKNLGVRNGDTMLVHSSLSSFGHVEER